MNHLRQLLALGAFALSLVSPSHAAEIQAYAGAVAGFRQGGVGVFGCATSGPTIPAPWYAGITLPLEGIATCNLAGGIDEKFASSGTLTASQSVSGPAVNGTFTGSAQARAGFWDLGVKVEGSNTGGSTGGVYRQTAAFARFSVPLTLTSPGLATGTPGVVNFRFDLDGTMSSIHTPPYTQQIDVYLGLRVDNRGSGSWTAFAATLINDGQPYVRGGSTGLPGSFVLGAGSLSGGASIVTTADFAILWGVPFEVEVALYAQQSTCCYGTSLSADFLNSAKLSGIRASGPGGLVTDFSGVDGAGNLLGPNGLLPPPVPEPGTVALMLAGLVGVAAVARRERRAADRAA